MKKACILILIFFLTLTIQAQEVIAKYKFQEAEDAYNKGRYTEALQNLKEVDRMLGRMTPATLFLKILSEDKLLGSKPLSNLDELAQLQEDFQYYLKNFEKSDESKYIDIYKISERYKKLNMDTKLIRLAAAGDAKACMTLGNKCESIGFKDDAIRLYKISADQGHMPAIISLSYSYYYGINVTKDKKIAEKYLKPAAESGDWHANDCLAILYYTTNKTLSKEYANKGFQLTMNEAQKGNVNAQYYLGYFYEYGLGVKKNDEKALECYNKVNDESIFLESAIERCKWIKDKSALIQKGDELLESGNYAEAIANFEKTNDEWNLREKLFKAHKLLGEKYLEKGQYSEAVLNLTKAFEYNPGGIEYARIEKLEKLAKDQEAYQLAFKFQDLKNCEFYLDKFPEGQKITEVNKMLSEIYKNTAESFFSVDKYAKALEYYQKYLTRYPNGTFANEAEKKLKICNRKLK